MMKQKFLLKTLLLLCALVAGSGTMWGDDIVVTWNISGVATTATYQQVNTALTASSITPSGASGTWTAVSDSNNSYAGSSTGAQLGASSSRQFTGTISLSNTSIPSTATVKSVVVSAKSNGSSTLSATVGGMSLGDSKTISGTTVSNYTISGSSQTGNTIVLTLSETTVSKYVNISKIVVTYDDTPAKTLSSIAVTTSPTKTAYKIGETLDLTGIVVTGTYDDNSTEDVTSECTFSPANGAVLGTAGNQDVSISYGGKNTTQAITVASVTGLAVKTAPTKVKYRIGDNLDLTDLVLTATYSDASTQDINTGFTASPTDGSALNTAGNVDVTLSYYGQSCTQRVTVGNLSSISYNATGEGAFANTTYTEKETFDSDGLVVTAHFDNDLDVVVATGYTLSPDTETELQTTDENVTVSYTWNEVEKTVNIPITVNAGPKYTVSFDAGNGTYSGGDKTETAYQGGVVMPTPTGIPTGWSFYGWATSKQTSETNEAPSVTASGATYYPTADVTLYAVYSLVEGGEKTITATDMSGANSTATTLKTGHPITYKVSSGANSSPMRWYSGGILTMAGATMTKIQFTMNGNYSASDITLNAGGGAYSNGTWTGESSEVKFRASSQVRIDEIKVTYTSSSTVYSSLPAPKAELSYAETEYDAALGRSFTKPALTNINNVTVTYESEDEDVATVDENTGDVTIVGLGTTTITASFAGNASYRANSASYTLNVYYGNIAQIKELTSNATPVSFTALLQDAVVTYVDGDYAYIKDASAAVMVNFEDHGLTAGDKINGKVTGTVKASNAIDVLTAFDTSEATVTDDGDIPTAAEKTLAEIKAAGTDYDGKLVKVSGAKVTTALTDNANGDITDDNGTTTFKLVCPYTGINVAKDAEGNFTGFVSIYVSGANTTYRLNIYDDSQISLTKNAPTAQTLTFASDAIVLDEDTNDYNSFTGQEVSGAQGTVTYALTGDAIGTVNENTGAVTLNGSYGTATITATAAAKNVTEAGVTTPYTETTKTYTITVRPRYSSTFYVNGIETVVRQTSYGAEITVPTPTATVGDYHFVGWKASSAIATPTDEAPAMVTPPTTPTSNVTYYAVYAREVIGDEEDVQSTMTFNSGTLTSGYINNGVTWTFSGVTFLNSGNNVGMPNGAVVTFTLPSNSIKTKSVVAAKTQDWSTSNISIALTDDENNQLSTFNNAFSYNFTNDNNQSSYYTLTATNQSSKTAWIGTLTVTYSVLGTTYVGYTTSLPTVELSIGASGYAAFCYGRALDFSSTDVKAYKAKVVGDKVRLTQISDGIVPANTGVVLAGDEDSYTVPTATDDASTDFSDNEMVGVVTRTQVLWNPSANVYNYILQQGKFNKATDGYLKANRAYLSTSYQISGARSLEIFFDDDTTTEINNVNVDLNDNNVYDMQGRKVNGQSSMVNGQLKKGLYIVNGKKVVIK